MEVLRELDKVKRKLQVGPGSVSPPSLPDGCTFHSLRPLCPPEKREDAQHAVREHRGTDDFDWDGTLLKGLCNICGRLVIVVGLPPSASATVATRQMLV